MNNEHLKNIIDQANGNIMTALENQILADIGGSRKQANLVANHILDIIDAFEENKKASNSTAKELAKMMETHRMITMSTGHITPETNEMMLNQTEFDGISYYPKDEYGYFILVYIDEAKDYKDVPCDLMELLYFAKDYGYDMICLDSDGPDMSAYGLHMCHWEKSDNKFDGGKKCTDI